VIAKKRIAGAIDNPMGCLDVLANAGRISQSASQRREPKSCLAILLMGRPIEETTMKIKTIALASVFALSSTLAFAQGATGPAAQQDNMTKPGTTGTMEKGSMEKGTTGMGTGTKGFAAKPGGMDKSKPGGQSTARNPAD
jgi:hypothetical protein